MSNIPGKHSANGKSLKICKNICKRYFCEIAYVTKNMGLFNPNMKENRSS